MGADPAELQREIAAQRRLIEGKVDALRERIRSDVSSAREEIRGLKDRLPGGDGHTTAEVEVHDDGREARPTGSFSLDGIEVLGYDLGKLGLEDRVGSHPMSSMAMAVGAGLVLGMMSGADEQRERDYRRSYRDDRRRGGGGFFAPLMTALEDRTQDEIGRFVNQAADRIKHGQPGRSESKQAGGQHYGNGHKSPSDEAPREAPARIAN
jgi:ElaB/YqjD/DUF883 family membrane-anchored ribosome-binding protein